MKGLVVIIAYALASGCAPPYRIAPREVHFTPDSDADPYWAQAKSRDVKTVAITESDLARPYKKMGRFTVASVGLDTKISIDRMRAEAALRGLDAIIHIAVSKTSTGGSSNEAVNYFFPPVVHHSVEGIGVVFAENSSLQAPPPPTPAPPIPQPAPPAPISTPPAPEAAAPPPQPSASQHAPLPPADVFTDEHK